MSAWDEGRPIYRRLPEESEQYQGNPICHALTLPLDNFLVTLREKVQNVYPNFINPETCQPDALDWLAQHYGFTREYWDTTWSDSTKRTLIKNNFWIWENKGTRAVIEFLFSIFEINARLYYFGAFLVGISKVGEPLGGEPFRFWILMPLEYRRVEGKWILTERLVKLYAPVYSLGQVVYKRFYIGFSKIGEPLFKL